jgi:hypothetical protein
VSDTPRNAAAVSSRTQPQPPAQPTRAPRQGGASGPAGASPVPLLLRRLLVLQLAVERCL